MAEDTMGMGKVTIKEFTDMIAMQLRPDYRFERSPVLGIGKSGTGKSEAVKALAMKLGIGFKEIRLVSHSETDLMGLPGHKTIEISVNGVKNLEEFMTFFKTRMLPHPGIDPDRGILVFDEITSAAESVRTSAFQLMDSSRSIGEYKFPPGWIIVALGNGPDDGGDFQGLRSAFINRCYSYRIEPDINEWLQWAREHSVHPAIIAFVQARPDYFHKVPTSEHGEAFSSPRGWVNASKVMVSAEEFRVKDGYSKFLPAREVMKAAMGSVGNVVGEAFVVFYNYSQSMPDFSKIAKGEKPKFIPPVNANNRPDQSAVYLLVQTAISYLYGEYGRLSIASNPTPKSKMEFDVIFLNVIEWTIAAINGMANSISKIDVIASMVSDCGVLMPMTRAIFLDRKKMEKMPNLRKFVQENSKVFEYDNSGSRR